MCYLLQSHWFVQAECACIVLYSLYTHTIVFCTTTWHGDVCVERISPNVRVRTSEVVNMKITCITRVVNRVTRVDLFVSAVAVHVWE